MLYSRGWVPLARRRHLQGAEIRGGGGHGRDGQVVVAVRPSIAWVLILGVVLLAMPAPALGSTADPTDATKLLGKSKAVTLNKCIDIINVIDEATTQGNSMACLQCDPTSGVCPVGCQSLIASLWENCNGVSLPDGLYFDPSQTLTGTWSKDTEAKLTEAARRCGCSPAGSRGLSALALAIPALMVCWLGWS